MSYLWLSLQYLTICTVFVSVTETTIIQTPLGPIEGQVEITDKGTEFYAYEGIPYAKPPTGELRFKPPQPVEPWTDPFVATTNNAMCSQNLFGSIMGTEDCLFLNVFSPKKSFDDPLPVMMFIHGGGFIMGSGIRMFSGGPDYFMDKDVVLVTINYRLGPLGFLSTCDSEASGNYGLLDQVAALQWIQKNIASFGGDPNKVTIFGESAGAASVHFLVLSPLAKGLFHGAISQSGQAVTPWALTLQADESAKELAEKLGCPTTSKEMLKCLKDADATQLIKYSKSEQSFIIFPMQWGPRIDSEAEASFLPEFPLEMIKKGNVNPVPYVAGVNRDEGLFLTTENPMVDAEESLKLYSSWSETCRHMLADKPFGVTEEESKLRCQKILQYYVAERDLSNHQNQGYIDMLSAIHFTWAWQKCIEHSWNHQPIYAYTFDFYTPKASLIGFMGKLKEENLGVNHADDLLYLFKFPIPELEESAERNMRELMTSVWTNFAKTGIPTFDTQEVEWPRSTGPDYKYVSLTLNPEIKTNYKQEEMKFWDEIFGNTVYKSRSIKDEL